MSNRPYTGSAVVNGKIRFSSITQIKLFDPRSEGCNRKWWFQYPGKKKLLKTDALDKGIDFGGKLEHYLKTGEMVLPPTLQPAQKFYPEPRNPLTGELDLEVEQPLGDIVKAVHFRDEYLKAANESQAFKDEILARMKRFAGLSAKDIPLDGAADYKHRRGSYKNEEGVETREHPSICVGEIGDQKVISRIKPHKIMRGENAGLVLPGWAKTGAQICDDVQMVSYGRSEIDKHPELTHIRLSHVYAQKTSKGGAKRTGLISVDEVLFRFERVENLVGEMVDVATADRVDDIKYNNYACDSFTHVSPEDGKTILPGCGHRYYCSLPNTVAVQNILGRYKESAMSLFDKLPPGALPGSSDAPPTTPTSPLSSPLHLHDAVADRAAVEEYKKKLRAEDAARSTNPIMIKIGCGAPGCGDGCGVGWIRSPEGGIGAFLTCPACKGEGKQIRLAAGSEEAPPPPPSPHPMAVTPPDAPPPAPLIEAAAPLPPSAVAEITNPVLKATVEAHSKEHARLQAEKDAAEAAAKQAAGTSVWCAGSSKALIPTMEQALVGKFVCECTKVFSLKSLKQDDGMFLVKRHKPVNKPEAVAPVLTIVGDDDDDEGELLQVPEAPPPPPASPGEMTQMVNEMFGAPSDVPPPPPPPAHVNGKNGAAKVEPSVPWSTPTIITLLRSIDESLKVLVALAREGEVVGFRPEGPKSEAEHD